jgi:hypothetical protein
MTTAQINLDALHSLVTQEPLAIAGKQFGDPGTARVKGILRFLKLCARHCTVDEKSDVKVFALLKSDPLVESLRTLHASPFQSGVSALGSIESLLVEIREDDSPFVWMSVPPQITSVIETGVVYRLAQSVETFSISGNTVVVPKVIQDAVSQFLLNYFKDLRLALLAYRDSMARTSKCHLLRQAWADDKRLWFTTKPERRLRRALHNHLVSYLRFGEIDLREEQNVDDSHPVDIKILWRMENRTAIIEVKWIGKSIDIETRKITASYTDSRARDGAKQLAEYLEEHRQQAAKEDTRGYLIVFDCRRRGLKTSTTAVARAEGFYYAKREVTYAPKFHKRRRDFEEPIRMFLEPVCI